MITETFTFQGSDGKSLFARKWLPASDAPLRAVIQISHGMAEHSERYGRFAEQLTGAGFGVYANDHRGHGYTEGSVDQLGNYADQNGWDLVVNDMKRLTDIIRKAHPEIPVFIFAHSMGSFLTRDYMFSYPEALQGIILSGTGGDPGITGSAGFIVAAVESSLRGKTAQSKLMDKMSFGSFNKPFKPNRTDFDWLSSDNDEVDKYINDPFCGTVFTAGFFKDLLSGLKKINKPSNINKVPKDLPVYMFSGAADPVGNFTKGVTQAYNAYKNAGIKDLSLRFYENGRHEMLNETNRDEVMSDVIQWIDSHL